MRAVFVIPVHCTNPIQLLYAENLLTNNELVWLTFMEELYFLF